jgi:2-methylcitrate dehydratase PrpD
MSGSSGGAGRPDAMIDLVRWARGLRLDDVPEAVVDATKQRVLDLVGAALAGTQAQGVPELLGVVETWGANPCASIIGSPVRTSLPLAVMVNATVARALELDDVHERALLHPTVATAPIALGVAELAGDGGGADGVRLLTSLVAAQEVMCRLGLAPEYHVSGPLHRPRGWSYTYQCGILGGALTAALLRGFDEDRCLDAVGNAYTALAGNQQAIKEATLAIRVQQGVAAQTAVQSADLAGAGITGPHDVLEGMYGWLTYWQGGSYDRDVLLGGLGERWELAETSIKPYPVCRITHNAVDATRAVMRDNRLGPEDVERLVVHVNSEESWEEVVDPLERRRRPSSPMDAQFSLPFVCATTVLHGTITLEHLSDKAIHASEVLAMAQRVEPVLDEDRGGVVGRAIPMPVVVDVHSRGQVFTSRSDLPLGHPTKPLGWDGIEAKVRDCARTGEAPSDDAVVDELIAAVRDLERDAHPGRIMALLAKARSIPGAALSGSAA